MPLHRPRWHNEEARPARNHRTGYLLNCPTRVKLSAVSLAELEYGASKSRRREKNRNALLRFVAAFDIVPFDDRDAEVYGLIRAGLERRGQLIGPYDLQIAAQAITRGLVLVTNTVEEFRRVPELRIQNWTR